MAGPLFALDLATCTGWASGVPGMGTPASGSVRLKRSDEAPAVAYANLMAFLADMWADERPALVVKEAPIPLQAFSNLGNAAATVTMTIGLHAVCEGMCRRFSIPFEQAADSTIRKHFIGRGRMGTRAESKAAVIARCHLLGLMPKDSTDDNRADALAAWDWGAMVFGRKPFDGERLYLFGEQAA